MSNELEKDGTQKSGVMRGSGYGIGQDTAKMYSTFVPPNVSISSITSNTNMVTATSKGELHLMLETLLLAGKREEAIAVSVMHKEWAMAMLIASNCGSVEYSEVSKAYAESSFPAATPLHLATLLFSNQVCTNVHMYTLIHAYTNINKIK